jgi:hypothetical protein
VLRASFCVSHQFRVQFLGALRWERRDAVDSGVPMLVDSAFCRSAGADGAASSILREAMKGFADITRRMS